MKKKQIIQIVVIVVAFGASGFVLYNGFFKSPSYAPASPTSIVPGAGNALPAAGAGASQALLPAGSQLDFSILQSQNLTPENITYPVLSTTTDIGIPEQNLITALPSTQ